MAHLNEIVVKTAKIKGSSEKDVLVSLASAFPDFKVDNLEDAKTDWKAFLSRELSNEELVKIAAPEFGEKEEKPEVEDTSSKPEPETSSKPDGESDGEPKLPGEKDESSSTQLQDIESLLLELKTQVQKLQEKAEVVDEIHNTTKPHVEPEPELGPGSGLDDPSKLGPTAPPGGNPMGLNKPKAPNAPFGGGGGAPGGGGRPRPPMPMGGVKVAYARINDNGVFLKMADVIEAMHMKYPAYEVKNIQKDVTNNRYVARLELVQ